MLDFRAQSTEHSDDLVEYFVVRIDELKNISLFVRFDCQSNRIDYGVPDLAERLIKSLLDLLKLYSIVVDKLLKLLLLSLTNKT